MAESSARNSDRIEGQAAYRSLAWEPVHLGNPARIAAG